MIIGGAKFYSTMMEYADKLILTEIDAEDREADVYFPKFNKEEWNIIDLGEHEEENIRYKHCIYTKKIG